MRIQYISALAQTLSATTAILTAEGWANALEKSEKSLSAKQNQWDALHANGVIDPQTKYKK